MKKLIALCAVLGFTATANAQAEISHNGGFRLQYMNTDTANFNEDTSGRTHDWAQRFQWNMDIKAGENVNAHVKLVHAADWGTNTDQVPGNDGGDEQTENVLVVNEAYANWMISDEMTARFGRGSMTMADGTVVAVNEWEQIQKAFDGGIFMYDHEIAKISAFGVRGANLSNNNDAAYGNFTGVAFDFKSLPEFLKTAHLHYVMVKTDETVATDKEDTTRLGLTVGGDANAVDYRATYAMYSGETANAGTTTDVSASMMEAEVGFSMPETMNMRISALYHSDSGTASGSSDDETYDGFHYDTHNNAGLMDLLEWGNLTYMKLAVTFDTSESTSVGVAYYSFTASEESDTTLNGSLSIADATADDIGSEIDLWATHRYTENFSITGWYSMFTPGDRVAADGDDSNMLYFAGNYTF